MNIENKVDKIVASLLTLAIASLIIRKGNFMLTFLPKPFEIILALAILVLIVGWLFKKIKFSEFAVLIPKEIFWAILGLIVSTLIGWAITIFGKGVSINSAMIFDFGRMITALVIFVLVLAFTKKYSSLSKYFFFALFSPIIYIICLISPALSLHYGLALSDGRFYGLMNNPSTISKLILIPLLFTFSLFLFEKKNRWWKAGFLVIAIGLMSLIFWSGTRAAILSVGVGFALVILFYLKYNFTKKDLMVSLLSLFLIFFLGFILTPNLSKKVLINRILTKNTDVAQVTELKDLKIKEVIEKSVATKSSGNPETRLTIWPYFIKVIIRNPLGMGPAYYTHTFLRLGPNDDIAGAHNSYLEVMLYGGWLALASFLFLLISAVKNLILRIKNDPVKALPVALLGALTALALALAFDDHFKLYWFWILLALSFLPPISIQPD